MSYKVKKIKAGFYRSEDGKILIEKHAATRMFRDPTWLAFEDGKEIASSDSLSDLKAQLSRIASKKI